MPADARNRSIRTAIWTSLLSKAGTVALQLIALPQAMRVLGWEQFGLYASVAGVLVTVQLFELGLGPALTHGISRAAAEGDRDRERTLAATAFFLLLGLAALAVTVLGLGIALVPVPWMFGQAFVAHAADLAPALWTGLALCGLMVVLNHTERVREGYLEARLNNAWGAAANFAAAGLVLAAIGRSPSVVFLLLAVFGSSVLAKLGNTIQLWRSRRWVVPVWSRFRPRLARWLLTDSLAYLVLTVVAAMVELYVVQNLYGRLAGPAGVTAYAVLATLTTATLGFVLMVTTPTWPAVVDARSRGDLAWIRRVVRRLRAYAVAVAVCAGGGLVAVGPWLLPQWVGPRAAALDRTVLAAYAFYLLVYAWRHTHHMLLIGLGRVRLLAGVQVLESALVLGAAWVGMHHGGLPALFLAMAATISLATGWVLPWVLHRDLRLGVGPARL